LSAEYILFACLGFSASLISAVFGLGTALVVLSLGAYVLPVKESIVLASVLFAASTLTKSVLFYQVIEWKQAGVMILASIPFTYLGALAFGYLPADLLRKFLGAMILLYLAISFFGSVIRWKPTMTGLFCGSAAYGFISGILGSGNIIKALVLRGVNYPKEVFVGMMAVTSVLANFVKIIVFSRAGALHAGQKEIIFLLVIGAIIAAFIGRFYLKKISVKQFEVGLNTILGVSAIGLLF